MVYLFYTTLICVDSAPSIKYFAFTFVISGTSNNNQQARLVACNVTNDYGIVSSLYHIFNFYCKGVGGEELLIKKKTFS